MQPVTIFTTRHFVDHELRGNQTEFWSLEFEPLLCLNLQGRDRGIFARPSSRVTDNLSFYVHGIHASILPQGTATITEWPTKWFLKLSAADWPLWCMVLFWLFFVLVLDRSSNCIIPSWSTRCSGGNLVMDWLVEIRSIIHELGNGGLWAVTEVALMLSVGALKGAISERF